MSGHEAGATATDDCNLQAVILWLLVLLYGLHDRFRPRLVEITMVVEAVGIENIWFRAESGNYG